jgi:hypothetical protein
MRAGLDPFSFLVISVASWLNQRQQHVSEYLVAAALTESERVRGALREKYQRRMVGSRDAFR